MEIMLKNLFSKIRTPKIIAADRESKVFKSGHYKCILPPGNDYISVISDIPSSSGNSGRLNVVILDPEHKIRYSQAILGLAIFPPLERKGTIAKLYREYGYVICDVSFYDNKQVKEVISLLDKIYNFPEYTPKNKSSWLSDALKTHNPEDEIFADPKGEIMKLKNELAERGCAIQSLPLQKDKE